MVLLMELWVQDVPKGGKMRGRSVRPLALSVCPQGWGWEEPLVVWYLLSDHNVPLRGLGEGDKDESGTVPVCLSPSMAEQGPGYGRYSDVWIQRVHGRGGGAGQGALPSLLSPGRGRWHMRAAHLPQLRAESWRTRGRREEHSQTHNHWGPVQNENAGSSFKKQERIAIKGT